MNLLKRIFAFSFASMFLFSNYLYVFASDVAYNGIPKAMAANIITDNHTATPIPAELPYEYKLIEPPQANTNSGEVAYGAEVTLSLPKEGHIAYSINGGEFIYSYFSSVTIPITEDTTLRVKAWVDYVEKGVTYITPEKIYLYTVVPLQSTPKVVEPVENPTVIPTDIPGTEPKASPSPEPPTIYIDITPMPAELPQPITKQIEPPQANINSGIIAYGTGVVLSLPTEGHIAYSINDGEFTYSYFSSVTIPITEDTTLKVKAWIDYREPNITYITPEMTYTYTVSTSPQPTPDFSVFEPRINNGKYEISYVVGDTAIQGECLIAAYSDTNALIEVHQIKDLKYGDYTEQFEYRDDIYSFAVYLWNDMKPLCDSIKLYANNPIKASIQYNEDGTADVNIDSGAVQLEEADIVFPQTDLMWLPLMYNYNEYKEEARSFSNGYINVKRNGKYIIRTKDSRGVEGYREIYVTDIPYPQLSLTAEYEENSATISVSYTGDDDTFINELVYMCNLEEPVGHYSNAGVYEQYIAAEYGTPIDNQSFDVYENGKYLVVAIDAWGNAGSAEIEITDLN